MEPFRNIDDRDIENGIASHIKGQQGPNPRVAHCNTSCTYLRDKTLSTEVEHCISQHPDATNLVKVKQCRAASFSNPAQICLKRLHAAERSPGILMTTYGPWTACGVHVQNRHIPIELEPSIEMEPMVTKFRHPKKIKLVPIVFR